MLDPDTTQLLTVLHRMGAFGNWWTAPDKRTYWWPVGQMSPLPQGNVNVYYSVHPTRKMLGERERTRIEDVAAVSCLFGDFDAKNFGGDKNSTRDHIAQLPLQPSVVVDSGGGFHAYWLLREPLILDSPDALERAKRAQAGWVARVGGDPGAKDLAHVLRVPGTLNRKHEYAPYFPTVELVKADFSLAYSIEDLEGSIPQQVPVNLPAWPQLRMPTPANRTGYAATALARECETVAATAAGGRNSQLNKASFSLGQLIPLGLLDKAEVEERLFSAACAAGLDGDRDCGPTGIQATIQSGLRAGIQHPRDIPPVVSRSGASVAPLLAVDEAHTKLVATGSVEPSRETASGKPLSRRDLKVLKSSPPTDDALADAWLAMHPDTAWGLGEFRRYEGGIWPVVAEDVIRQEILAVLEGAKAEGIRPTSGRLASVMELGRIKAARPPEVWDANVDILICANGALDIPTRTLQPHQRQHYATARLDYDYDPRAVPKTWLSVLDRCARESQDFLREFAGYAITTDTQYELAVWLAGQPGGGKSTIVAGLEAMLRTRACLLGLADIEKSRFGLTNLPGKTLAVSTEQPGGYMSVASVLNAIISGEPITVDRKFRDPVTIIPRAKLLWAMNELPKVGPEGAGLFRRVKVVNLPPITEAERDPMVKERVKLEGAGILNWALDGLARLRQRGRFEIPASVREATNEFRATNDVAGQFVAECCTTGDSPNTGKPYRSQGSLLYAAYSAWCKDNGHKPCASNRIADDWRRLGFVNHSINGRSWWDGVGLVTN